MCSMSKDLEAEQLAHLHSTALVVCAGGPDMAPLLLQGNTAEQTELMAAYVKEQKQDPALGVDEAEMCARLLI